MTPGEDEVRRIGYGLVVMAAFIAALLIFAIWQNVGGP
jgi:hypothetical protein